MNLVGKLLAHVAMFYSLSVGIATLYYNWEYAHSHGFVRWIALGEIVSTAKALAWPYFALHTNATASSGNSNSIPGEIDKTRLSAQQISEMEAKKLMLALNYSQQATYLLNSTPHERVDEYPNLPDIIGYRRKALDVGKVVDTGVLNGIYPELGDRFKSQFLEAVTLFVEGCETGSDRDLIRS